MSYVSYGTLAFCLEFYTCRCSIYLHSLVAYMHGVLVRAWGDGSIPPPVWLTPASAYSSYLILKSRMRSP